MFAKKAQQGGFSLGLLLTGVVKASITGSIIGNILLLLGASILAGKSPKMMRHPKPSIS